MVFSPDRQKIPQGMIKFTERELQIFNLLSECDCARRTILHGFWSSRQKGRRKIEALIFNGYLWSYSTEAGEIIILSPYTAEHCRLKSYTPLNKKTLIKKALEAEVYLRAVVQGIHISFLKDAEPVPAVKLKNTVLNVFVLFEDDLLPPKSALKNSPVNIIICENDEHLKSVIKDIKEMKSSALLTSAEYLENLPLSEAFFDKEGNKLKIAAFEKK